MKLLIMQYSDIFSSAPCSETPSLDNFCRILTMVC